MIYRFTLISNEVDDFVREIKIDAEASFYDLHKAILAACNYADDQPTSFFTCNKHYCWRTWARAARTKTCC